MTLQQQVTSGEISNKLKDLNVTAPSYFFREWRGAKEDKIDTWGDNESYYGEDNVNCYTVAELGEMLNEKYPNVFVTYKEKLIGDLWWVCVSRVAIEPLKENDYQYAHSEADARAKMLIYLLENKLVGN